MLIAMWITPYNNVTAFTKTCGNYSFNIVDSFYPTLCVASTQQYGQYPFNVPPASSQGCW